MAKPFMIASRFDNLTVACAFIALITGGARRKNAIKCYILVAVLSTFRFMKMNRVD